MVAPETVDARLHSQAEDRDGEVEGEQQLNLILWIRHQKGQPWVLTCIFQHFFHLPVFFFFYFLQFGVFWGHDTATSATCFIDAKHWRRRGVEKFYPDCGKSKTEYTWVGRSRFSSVSEKRSWFGSEWHQNKSPKTVGICEKMWKLQCDFIATQHMLFLDLNFSLQTTMQTLLRINYWRTTTADVEIGYLFSLMLAA